MPIKFFTIKLALNSAILDGLRVNVVSRMMVTWRNSFLIHYSKFFLSLPYFMPHNMFIYNQIFSQPLKHSLFSLITASSIICVRGMFFHLEGPKSFRKAKWGGPKLFFPVGKGGTKFFLCMQRGNQKKLATGHHRQTAPPAGKK